MLSFAQFSAPGRLTALFCFSAVGWSIVKSLRFQRPVWTEALRRSAPSASSCCACWAKAATARSAPLQHRALHTLTAPSLCSHSPLWKVLPEIKPRLALRQSLARWNIPNSLCIHSLPLALWFVGDLLSLSLSLTQLCFLACGAVNAAEMCDLPLCWCCLGVSSTKSNRSKHRENICHESS